MDEIEAKAILHFHKFFNKDKGIIDVDLLKVVLKREFKINRGHNKA